MSYQLSSPRAQFRFTLLPEGGAPTAPHRLLPTPVFTPQCSLKHKDGRDAFCPAPYGEKQSRAVFLHCFFYPATPAATQGLHFQDEVAML